MGLCANAKDITTKIYFASQLDFFISIDKKTKQKGRERKK